jgi:hypothetical protein
VPRSPRTAPVIAIAFTAMAIAIAITAALAHAGTATPDTTTTSVTTKTTHTATGTTKTKIKVKTTSAKPATTKTPPPSNCDQGRDLDELGRPADATDTYIKGLADADARDCAKTALENLKADNAECAPAKALEDLDRDDDANAAYRKVLTTEPGSKCAQAGAKRTEDDRTLQWLTQAVKDAGTIATAAGIAFLLLVLVGWLLLIPATRVPWVRDRWPARPFRRVRVQIKDLDDSALPIAKLGVSTTGLLRARLRTDAADARFDQTSGSAAAADALDGLGEAGPQAKLIIAFIKILRSALPKRDWVVTGELQAKGADDEGISLAIDNGGTYVDFAAFWAQTMGGPAQNPPLEAESYRRLTVPAAGWLAFHIAQAEHPKDLLTTNAMSWALTRCGVYWYDQGKPEVARKFYERALGYDGENIAALANLGLLDADFEADLHEAVANLTLAAALLEARG